MAGRPKNDLTGQVFGELTVIEYAGNGKWLCQCEQGHRKNVYTTHLTGGYTKTCSECHNRKSNKFNDITNQTFGKLTARRYIGNNYWECECECGNKSYRARGYDLLNNNVTSCNICNKIKEDYSGQIINNWHIIRYLGKKKYLCKCLICGTEHEVFINNIKKGNSKCCTECANREKIKNNLEGRIFGNLKVIEYAGSSKWVCKCECGNTDVIPTNSLINGKRTCCSNCKVSSLLCDLTGKVIGNWLVLAYAGNLKWICECINCGELHEVYGYSLRNGTSKSCGCSQLIDITGQTFGEWTALEYIGKGYWRCRCSCGTYRDIKSYQLRRGETNSCGCKKSKYYRSKLLENLGELSYNKLENKRTIKQIQAVENNDNLLEFILSEFSETPTTYQLSTKLGLNVSNTLKYIHKYELEGFVNIGAFLSKEEDEVYNILIDIIEKHNLKYTVKRRVRNLISNKELDLYIPELNLAIEFNGSYWHSSIYKDKFYHQQKTIECNQKGIRLLHIFEYEWNNINIKYKIINQLNKILNDENNKIYARDTEIKLIESSETRKFLDENHLQGYINTSINLGCFYGNELIGVMTFGKPRFNKGFDYELIRLCWKSSIYVVGGTQKLFSYFVNNYKPITVISYCDISKFNGDVYKRLGFEFSRLSEPNYKWVNTITNDVLSRYQTQKHKLVEQGLGTEAETEDEIMESFGYLKIYDSGNSVYTWRNTIY